MLVIDSTYFGKITFAPLNIILYNVFSAHGPDLYGTEPLTFYLLNGFLNFNVIWLLALVTPLLLLLGYFLVPAKSKATLYLPHHISLAPFYLWLLVFVAQPHKEERFLYPVYFMIALCGAISMDIIQKIYFRIKCWLLNIVATAATGTHYLDHTAWISAVVMIVTTVLGLSKICSLYYNFHAPLDLMMELNTFYHSDEYRARPNGSAYNVCVGKDWHRYPSSFFLPATDFRVRFVRSEFKGILPAYFTEGVDGGGGEPTAITHAYFNDMNVENEAMYFDYKDCDFLLDLNTERYTELEPNYVARKDEWRVLKTLPFLNAERSNRVWRSFYVPFVTDKYVEYADFNLLQRISGRDGVPAAAAAAATQKKERAGSGQKQK